MPVETTAPRFPYASLDDVPQDVREAILQVQDKAGFVPNVYLMLAAPAEFRRSSLPRRGHGRPGRLDADQGDREMVVTSISAANRCTYCVVAHGALLGSTPSSRCSPTRSPRTTSPPTSPPASARCWTSRTGSTPAATRWVTRTSPRSREHGFDAEDAWDITAITALFGLSNRVASVTGLMPNAEFYLMGRVPRDRT